MILKEFGTIVLYYGRWQEAMRTERINALLELASLMGGTAGRDRRKGEDMGQGMYKTG